MSTNRRLPNPAVPRLARRALALALCAIGAAGCDSPSNVTGAAGPVSLALSLVTVSTAVVQVGTTALVTLRARDAAGRNLTTGGLSVAFTTSGGSALGSFSPTVDNDNGTYQATFTAAQTGTPTSIGATIDGQPVTSQPPTVQVVALPPGTQVCEAVPPARCWYVSASAGTGGNGTFTDPFRMPQSAVDASGPGDFIYLRGGAEYTHAHSPTDNLFATSGAASGAPGQVITVKSHPSEPQAIIRGQQSGGVPTQNLSIRLTRSYWRVEGLRVIHGQICVACPFVKGVQSVWVVGNHVSDARASVGNFGLITVSGDQTVSTEHPRNIFIYDNTLHTLWGIQQDGSGPLPWYEDEDVEHHACVMIQNASALVEVVGNEMYECPSIFYAKYEGPGPTVVRANYAHDARNIGIAWRSARATFEDNVFARFTGLRAGFRLFTNSTTNVWLNNTFDFAPWSMNPEGSREVVNWNGAGDHVFRRNVVLTSLYHGSTPENFSANDIDENCAIWSTNFSAAIGQSWEAYQAAYGHDHAGARVMETDPAAVFADPAGGDYALIGAAAAQCAGAGAGAGN